MPHKIHIDPVCGMTVSSDSAKGNSEFEGHTYYFCSLKCKSKFDIHPNQYLHPTPQSQSHALGKDVDYTCPMHPEIRQKGPGSCPICGMALEPEEITLDETEDPELVDFTKRLKVSVPLTIPLLLLAMSDIIPGQPVQHAIPAWINAGIQFLLATPVVLWGASGGLK